MDEIPELLNDQEIEDVCLLMLHQDLKASDALRVVLDRKGIMEIEYIDQWHLGFRLNKKLAELKGKASPIVVLETGPVVLDTGPPKKQNP